MPIIRVDNLGKAYTIGHDRRAGGMFRYQSLRDTLAHQARAVWQRFRHPLSPNRENTELEEFWALRDVSFEIQPGERVGIIGRNGAGKSTLLKLVSRIAEPTTGRIELNGRVASLLEVGTGFHPELTGRENIYLNGAILGMRRTEIKAKFDEIVDFAEVEKFLDTPVKRYSSGMYVRLAFAVAAHLEPEILLVDEVLAVGDAAFQKKCLGKMEDVAKNEGRTVLFVSHNMAAIENFCSHGILLEKGNATFFKNISHAISKYRTNSLAGLKSGTLKLNVRQGDKKVQFCGYDVKNADRERPYEIYSGCNLAITLEYLADSDLKGREIGVAMGIDNLNGTRIAHVSNETIHQQLIVDGNSGCVTFFFPSCPLAEGTYMVTLCATVAGGVSDWIRDAFSFDIEAGDFYRTGRIPERNQGDWLLNYTVSATGSL